MTRARPCLMLLVFPLASPALSQEMDAEALAPMDGQVACLPSGQWRRNTDPEGPFSGDWASIREAYEAARHEAHSTEEGYRAHNPGQQWLTRFDGHGFVIRPDAGDWTWGLELVSYGFPGSERLVESSASVSAEGGRVAYAWDATLEEWYKNDSRGLEHGYTMHQRPTWSGEGEPGELVFVLAVRGGLRPEVTAAARNVQFLDEEGAVLLTYSGLCVVDANGRDLPASFESSGQELRLSIDERGAHYPLTIDPLAQQAYLKASNPDFGDYFGISVAASGDTVVIGAPGEASNATGVNGDQSDNSADSSGAAYVFVRNGSTWIQQAYLKASNTGSLDQFGWCVSLSGDTLVVGAPYEASSAPGVNGDQSDRNAPGAGAAYVFVRSGSTWSQQAYVKASNPGGGLFASQGDRFGHAVAVSGNTLLVGAPWERSSATGVNGNQADNSAFGAGAAYLFVRHGTTWSQEAYLKASNAEGGITGQGGWLGWGDTFGGSVAVSGDTAVVGAAWESSNATGVNGNQSDNSMDAAGASYVFVRNGTSWTQEAYLKASNTGPGDLFGTVALAGETIVVGAPSEASRATGVNGDQSDDSAPMAGAAYVFLRNGTTWSQEAYLKASNAGGIDIGGPYGDQFGKAVSLSGNRVVIGAPTEGSAATGVDGDQADNSAHGAGAAYLFARSGATWTQEAYIKASNAHAYPHPFDSGDRFGHSAALAGSTLIIGALAEDSGASGVNGDQGDNLTPDAGAAYTFDLGAPGIPFCFGDSTGSACPCGNPGAGAGCKNSSGSGGMLISDGGASVGADDLIFMASSLLPGEPALLLCGLTTVNGGSGLPFGDGLRCTGGSAVRLGVQWPNASGDASWGPGLAGSGGWIAGDTRHFQGWYRDPVGSPCATGFNLTNGVSVVFTP